MDIIFTRHVSLSAIRELIGYHSSSRNRSTLHEVCKCCSLYQVYILLHLHHILLRKNVLHLGVWGELVNHKRSLTHRPSSQCWAPECPTHFVFVCLRFTGVACWVWVPSFLCDYISYMYAVCYTHVFSCT